MSIQQQREHLAQLAAIYGHYMGLAQAELSAELRLSVCELRLAAEDVAAVALDRREREAA